MFTYFWVIIAIIALIFEVVSSMSLTSIWFVVGALVAAVFSMLGVDFIWQALVFIIVSIIALIALRPILIVKMRGRIVATNADRLIGKQATLIQAITKDSWGALKVNGGEWSCISTNNVEIPIGESVRILAIEGSKLIVEKI